MNEKDSKAIHDLFYEFHSPDNLGLLKSKLSDYVTTMREETRRAAFKDCITELCIDCAEGNEPTFDVQARWYYHDTGTLEAVGCSASKLRIRTAALEAAEKGERDG